MGTGRAIAVTGGAGAQGVAGTAGLLLLTEAGVPIPIPGDLLMLFIGERAGAGAVPIWGAVLLLEVVAVAGLVALFLAARSGGALVARTGARIGITPDRLERVRAFLGRRGRAGLAIGRATPGLRTLTVVATAGTGLSARRALPALILGTTVFVQAHLALGLMLGGVARATLESAQGPFVLALVALAAMGLVFWLIRRGGRTGAHAWTEACCPVCLVAGGYGPAGRMGATLGGRHD